MSASYAELLKNPRWQKKRLQILERDEWTCQNCGNEEKTLHVHHRWYEFGLKPWEYDESALLTLCEGCHERATTDTKLLKLALRRLHPADLARVAGYIDGIVACSDLEKVTIKGWEQAYGIADSVGVTPDEILESSGVGDVPVDVASFEIEGTKRHAEFLQAVRARAAKS